MLTFDIKWISPIRVALFEDDVNVVEGPMQALALLHDDWPAAGGKHHQAALQECQLACHELGKSEKAREAFMAAALEAGILVFAQSKGDQRRGLPIRPTLARAKGYALPL